MSKLSSAQRISEARLMAQDDLASGTGLTDAQYRILDRRCVQEYFAEYPQSLQYVGDNITCDAGREEMPMPSFGYNIRRYIRLHIGSITGAVLEKQKPHEILSLQQSDPTPGTIAKYSLEPRDQMDKWVLLLHPIPSGSTTLVPVVEIYPADDGSEAADHESRIISDMLAFKAAFLNGQPETFCEKLLIGLPEKIQKNYRVGLHYTSPRPRPPQDVAA